MSFTKANKAPALRWTKAQTPCYGPEALFPCGRLLGDSNCAGMRIPPTSSTFLMFTKSLKESESQRISLLLGALNGQTLTAMELLHHCSSSLRARLPQPDEKTIRSDLKYLEEVGFIRREPGPHPYRYRMQDDLVRGLTERSCWICTTSWMSWRRRRSPPFKAICCATSSRSISCARKPAARPGAFLV